MIVNKIALILSIIGSLNWGLVGLFSFDLVALAGIWCISMLFTGNDELTEQHV